VANNNAELRRLAERVTKVEQCCKDLAVADKLAVSAAQKVDRLAEDFGEFRREVRTEFKVFRLWFKGIFQGRLPK
jgi:hypothetical protein